MDIDSPEDKGGNKTFFQQRLERLNKVDNNLVLTINDASKIIEALYELKQPQHEQLKIDSLKKVFKEEIINYHTNLYNAVNILKSELKLLESNIGERLLPISLSSKRNIGQDDEKLEEQWDLLEKRLK
ncbi:Med11p SCDLUD_003994 [Saccharomycodes ludwigii]|uniref:Med11p n=1 Tax=Saccharomycodes ludwigii TaxID=36035 RepID=UPI001E8260F1|nr:hypothetical protein SCDLUD_003994 [Saccharomycodes ludwigii]KAH3899709.1 hypothetical protein SCDLUD_003994 [Saccharomycodes ludwigii]